LLGYTAGFNAWRDVVELFANRDTIRDLLECRRKEELNNGKSYKSPFERERFGAVCKVDGV
jgi:hypothetical protein